MCQGCLWPSDVIWTYANAEKPIPRHYKRTLSGASGWHSTQNIFTKVTKAEFILMWCAAGFLLSSEKWQTSKSRTQTRGSGVILQLWAYVLLHCDFAFKEPMCCSGHWQLMLSYGSTFTQRKGVTDPLRPCYPPCVHRKSLTCASQKF